MNDLTPAEQRIADALAAGSRWLDVADTPVTQVVRRGRQRIERRRAAVGVAAVATLSAGAIASIQLLSRPAAHRLVPADDSVPTDDTMTEPASTLGQVAAGQDLTPANRVDSNLVWNAVEPGTDEALGMTIFYTANTPATQAPFLAWSSAPGKVPGNQEYQGVPTPMLYRSDDGIHWTPANGSTFTVPDVSMHGTGSHNGRFFAFGTTAATAPISANDAGDVVMDVSDDLGTTWQDIVLPVDLRSLADQPGVQSSYFRGSMAAGSRGVVALALPMINFSPSVFARFPQGFVPERDGAAAISYPTCAGSTIAPTTTLAGPGYTAPAGTTAATLPAAPEATTTTLSPSSKACDDLQTHIGDVVPWDELGVDPSAVAATLQPRVFVSTDGQHFDEGTFPVLSNALVGQISMTASAAGYLAVVQQSDGINTVAKLYSSSDGMTWTEAALPDAYYDSVNVLDDGTIVAFAQAPTAYVAVSKDGSTWTKVSLSPMLDPDEVGGRLNVVFESAGPSGISVFGYVSWNDATGTSKPVILHSMDGINWSRDDVEAIAGRSGLSPTRMQVTDTNVLVSVADLQSRDPRGIPKTIVLVGTPKA